MTERRVVSVTVPEVTDPKLKSRLLNCLETDELTFDLGVETAEAGITLMNGPIDASAPRNSGAASCRP
jgi:hypothetical protein